MQRTGLRPAADRQDVRRTPEHCYAQAVTHKLQAADVALRGNQALTLYTCAAADGLYELWIVGRARTAGVIDHYFTHDDLVSHLSYAVPGDLRWRDAPLSAIPANRMGHGFVLGVSVAAHKVIDHERAQYHLANGLSALPLDKAVAHRAGKLLVASWSDTVTSLTLGADGVLAVSGTPNREHPLFDLSPAPDTWSFFQWQLRLLHQSTGRGLRLVVLSVTDRELHIAQAAARHTAMIAHVFTRAS